MSQTLAPRPRPAGGIRDRRQLHPPHATLESLRQIFPDRQGQAGLASTARTGQRKEANVAKTPLHFGRLPIVPDEAGQLRRQNAIRASWGTGKVNHTAAFQIAPK
jgi:hypothetical protein